jgi:uncharacterized membrane protein YjgN (DUF898 family)
MEKYTDLPYGPEQRFGRDSFFDGGLLPYIGHCILAFFVVICTFGIGTPWATCILYKWKIEHTVVDGYRLEFTGTGAGLFGSWIKWWFFIIITFGIYSFWVHLKLEDWKASHTHFIY